MNKLLLFIIILFLQTHLLAQNTNKHEGAVLMFNVHYAFQQPSGDLSQRFGRSNQIGLDIDYLTKKNFILGGSAAYQFGTEVREDVISTLRDNNGTIVGNDQGIASVVYASEVYDLMGFLERLFHYKKDNALAFEFQLEQVSINIGFEYKTIQKRLINLKATIKKVMIVYPMGSQLLNSLAIKY